jgi:hypothetical protein
LLKNAQIGHDLEIIASSAAVYSSSFKLKKELVVDMVGLQYGWVPAKSSPLGAKRGMNCPALRLGKKGEIEALILIYFLS